MRLIDADKLNFSEQHYNKSQMKAILDFIDNQPTAYDVNKVINQMEKDKFIDCETILSDVHQGYNAGLSRAIEIVKAGVKENGYSSCRRLHIFRFIFKAIKES